MEENISGIYQTDHFTVFMENVNLYIYFYNLQTDKEHLEAKLNKILEMKEEAQNTVKKLAKGLDDNEIRTEGEIKDLVMFCYHTKDISIENLIQFENRGFLLFVYSEMEQFFFKCFKDVILENPQILSNKTITVEKLLENRKRIDLIIEEKAEKLIHDVFYKSFSEIFEFATKKLGIKHNIQEKDILFLEEFKQMRNSYIHRDGKVNLIYLSKLPNSKLKLGDKILLTIEKLNGFCDRIEKILLSIDQTLIEQFKKMGRKHIIFSMEM